MLKNYHLHFEFWGLALFLAMMIPTLIWSVIPAPNDILRTEDAAGAFDMTVSLLAPDLDDRRAVHIAEPESRGAAPERPDDRSGSLLSAVFYKLDLLLYRSGRPDGDPGIDASALPGIPVVCHRQKKRNRTPSGACFYSLPSVQQPAKITPAYSDTHSRCRVYTRCSRQTS